MAWCRSFETICGKLPRDAPLSFFRPHVFLSGCVHFVLFGFLQTTERVVGIIHITTVQLPTCRGYSQRNCPYIRGILRSFTCRELHAVLGLSPFAHDTCQARILRVSFIVPATPAVKKPKHIFLCDLFHNLIRHAAAGSW